MASPRATSMRRSAAVAGVLFALLSTLQVLPAGAARERRGLDVCRGSGSIRAARLPSRVSHETCDLVGRDIRSGSLRVEVPSPGEGVAAAALRTDGERELTVVTELDGDVLIDDGSSAPATTSTTGATLTTAPAPCDERGIVGCLDPCQDDNFHVNGLNARVKEKQPWFFKASSTPSTMTRAQALTEIKAGTKNILNVKNDCSLGDVVSQTAPYKGVTAQGTGITVVGGAEDCASANGKSVVDFGALGAQTLGLACSHYSARRLAGPWFIVESDIRLKKTTPWTLVPDDPACTGQYDLLGVMTHERGHAFGLGHADNAIEHVPQTMFPAVFDCNGYARTLGKGDRAGLAFLY